MVNFEYVLRVCATAFVEYCSHSGLPLWGKNSWRAATCSHLDRHGIPNEFSAGRHPKSRTFSASKIHVLVPDFFPCSAVRASSSLTIITGWSYALRACCKRFRCAASTRIFRSSKRRSETYMVCRNRDFNVVISKVQVNSPEPGTSCLPPSLSMYTTKRGKTGR